MSIHSITTEDENETNWHFSSWTRDKSQRSHVEYIVARLVSANVPAGMNGKCSWALRTVVVLTHRATPCRWRYPQIREDHNRGGTSFAHWTRVQTRLKTTPTSFNQCNPRWLLVCRRRGKHPSSNETSQSPRKDPSGYTVSLRWRYRRWASIDYLFFQSRQGIGEWWSISILEVCIANSTGLSVETERFSAYRRRTLSELLMIIFIQACRWLCLRCWYVRYGVRWWLSSKRVINIFLRGENKCLDVKNVNHRVDTVSFGITCQAFFIVDASIERTTAGSDYWIIIISLNQHRHRTCKDVWLLPSACCPCCCSSSCQLKNDTIQTRP